jgi:hypothetical protein
VRPARKTTALGVLAACLALPLLGTWLAGRALPPLLRFPPPLNIPTDFPRFSWLAVALVSGAAALIAWPWVKRWRASNQAGPVRLEVEPLHPSGVQPSTPDTRRFPLWGWGAVVWTLGWWWLAWTRQPWFAWGQRYTFTPLWLGLIVTAGALTTARGGVPLMRRAPGQWLALFAASAAFWWVFEWLNRFVRNWHYLGVEGVGAWEYAMHSSICFSTVLPAVAGVREWFATMPRLQARLARGPAWPWLSRRAAGAVLAAAGAAGLVLTGARPLYFFPALWAAPLLIGGGLSVLGRGAGWWRELAEGDWRDAGSWALAALACGFFWELWNLHSLAKWVYTVPFVQRWPVFEMPLLGYSGYLAFGLECALATTWVLGREPTTGKSG